MILESFAGINGSTDRWAMAVCFGLMSIIVGDRSESAGCRECTAANENAAAGPQA